MKQISIKVWLPVIIILSLTLISIIYFNLPKVEQLPEITFPETTPKEQIPEIPENWKTYRNEEFNFQLSYPEDWEIEEEEDGRAGWFGKKFSFSKEEAGPKIIIIPYGLFTEVAPAVSRTSVRMGEIHFAGRKARVMYLLTGDGDVYRQFISGISNLPKSWSEHDLGSGGFIGIFLPISNVRKVSVEEECGYDTCIITFGDVDKKDSEIVNQILSTFKFIE